jgi:hypothetical protein
MSLFILWAAIFGFIIVVPPIRDEERRDVRKGYAGLTT